jgi:hypothetical protein
MTERDRLFRQEALEFRARGDETSGGVVRLGAPWLRWSYRILLLLAAGGAVLAWLLPTDESTTGPAVVDMRSGTFAALLPAASGPELSGARTVRLELPDGTRPVVVKVRHAAPARPAAIRRAGLPQQDQPAILLSGRLSRGAATGGWTGDGSPLHARIVVILRSASIGGVVIRQFKRMLGAERESA